MDESLEEEYLTATTTPQTKEELTALLKKFCFDLLQFLEQNLEFYKNILEDKEPEKKQTIAGKIASSLANAVPVYGKTVGAAIANGEIYYLRKVDKNRAVKLANLIYNYSDDRIKIRDFIIEAGVEIFCCFEGQFGGVTCNGGQKRAMFKLAKDASHRIFDFLLGEFLTVEREVFTKGVVFGQSLPNNFGQKKGKTLETWKTSSFYEKCGIFENNKFYSSEKTNSEKYGYRKLFSWEKIDDSWKEEEKKLTVNFSFKIEDFENLTKEVKSYVTSKNILEEAKLEREKYFQELTKKNQENHDDILENTQKNFNDLIKINQEILKNNKKETEIVQQIKENQNTINLKLEEIHEDIKQDKLIILEVKESQKKLEEINPDAVAMVTANLLIEKGKEAISKIGKDVDKNAKRIEKEAKRTTEKLKKIRIKF